MSIDDPIINSPYKKPSLHFMSDTRGLTSDIAVGRRTSAYYMPVPPPRGQQPQRELDLHEQRQENKLINEIRDAVSDWRESGRPGASNVSRELLSHWEHPDREFHLFFCQIEAVETAIYLAEAAGDESQRRTHEKILGELKAESENYNPGLFRIAFKIATGGGKTAVMAMLIAWQTLSKYAQPKSNRYSDCFLVVAPGITIRDRLRVLQPNDSENIYKAMDIAPMQRMERLNRAKIVITNYHGFIRREKSAVSAVAKNISGLDKSGANSESPSEMVARACREFSGARDIIVINDEAHHCYHPRKSDDKMSREERQESKRDKEHAMVWISGLESVRDALGIRRIYDLSATPFFLRGSGYSEGTLFPWVASDFSLVDAIESGVVKIPRVPIADDSARADGSPTYRKIWPHIKEGLPRQGRGNQPNLEGEPRLPQTLEGALRSLYTNYEKTHAEWESNGRKHGAPAPVFIVVCANTSISYLVYRFISGWEEKTENKSVLKSGGLKIFDNTENKRWRARPVTILVDSEELESGNAVSDKFKAVAADEIAIFKKELKSRGDSRADNITDSDLLREVMNTVGKKGKLGEHIKCVVSVSMLTEGWDASTVTHILGVRSFGTQLLCEQVIGRGLRRRSYEEASRENKTLTIFNGEQRQVNTFKPEYAEIFGVPFSPFMPTSGIGEPIPPPPLKTLVRALEEREELEIRFPRVLGFRYRLSAKKLTPRFFNESKIPLTSAKTPTITVIAPVAGGKKENMTLDELKKFRAQEVAYAIAHRTMKRYFRAEPGDDLQSWLFPQVLEITRRWMRECVTCGDGAFTQMLLMTERADLAAEKIYQAIIKGESCAGRKTLLPILPPYESEGSTRHIKFETAKAVYPTDKDKCHISHVVADTESWEQTFAFKLEQMKEVACYVKNDRHLGFYIPYDFEGISLRYEPDYIAVLRPRDSEVGGKNPLCLIAEVSGFRDDKKQAKVAGARLWVDAVNNDGRFGRWEFAEITNIQFARKDMQKAIDELLRR